MLECSNISVAFGDHVVLKNVSIELNTGQRSVLLGPSGSGKSTLLRILCGIQLPDKGNVSYNGISTNYEKNTFDLGLSRNWVWPKVCLLFQDLQLFPNLTGLYNCLIGMEERGSLLQEEVKELASRLRVMDCLQKVPQKMSQGEQQRIAIIRCLVREPDFLLMDEPTSALDPVVKKDLIKLLIERSESKKMGLLIATHDWEFANDVAHVFIMIRNNGVESFNSIQQALLL